MDYLAIAKQAKSQFRRAQANNGCDSLQPPANDLTQGRIIAVEICSNVLEADIWLAFDKDFNPNDGQALFYADELPFLATKHAETLREIHKMKIAFPGCRVIQEGAEATPSDN